MRKNIILLLLTAISCLASASPITVVTHAHGDIETYTPHLNVLYEVGLLKLALTNTIPEFGEFKLIGARRSDMTHLRATEVIRSQKIENYVKVLGYNEKYLVEKSMDFVRLNRPEFIGG